MEKEMSSPPRRTGQTSQLSGIMFDPTLGSHDRTTARFLRVITEYQISPMQIFSIVMLCKQHERIARDQNIYPASNQTINHEGAISVAQGP